MTDKVTIKVNGLVELAETFKQMQDDFGEKDANRVLQRAVLKSIKQTILPAAKMLAGEHRKTGLLESSLIGMSKKPNGRDKRSQYVSPTDVIIGLVQTRPIPKRYKREINRLYGNLKGNDYKRHKRKYLEEKGFFYDARAIANEFGTAERAATPFLRPAISLAGASALNDLSITFAQELTRYKSKKGK